MSDILYTRTCTICGSVDCEHLFPTDHPETTSFTREELEEAIGILDESIYTVKTIFKLKAKSLLDRNPDAKEFIIKPK